ncbi:MAG TPA: metal-dependent transcriptional regulator [Candidatus Aquilonibacter sp.]|nr:metal-dependent transcriptional regulator [Candidatus Aquilonibacter sp.]
MRREKTSVSQEDYLKAIWELVQEEQEPIGARLAEELGVTPPAVTAALKRMARDGYVRVQRNGHISLSPKGQKIAGDLVLRHRLAEKLLTDVIGLPWARAHEEAEKLEHGISAEVAELLVHRFGRDSRCPHGMPLLGGISELRKKFGAVRLSEAGTGASYEILRVYERDPKFLEFLNERNLRPAAHLRIHKREYDETISITVEGTAKEVHLGKPASERIWVRKSSS